MIRLLMSASAAALVASPALAGGTAPAPAPEPYIAPLPVEQTWDGAYAGVQLEYGDGEVAPGPADPDFDGNLIGIFGGYRADFGQIVIAGEIDYVRGDVSNSTGESLDAVLRSGLEVGYDLGDALVYGTIGGATAWLTAPIADTVDWGYFYGMGVDYRVTDSVVVGAELLHHQFDDFGNSGADLEATTFGLSVAFQF